MLPAIVIIFFTVIILYYKQSTKRLNQLARKIPGPTGYPIVGNALMFLGKPNAVLKRLQQISREYRRLVALWLGPKFVVLLFDARDVEVILRDRRTMEKAEEYRFLRPWLGDSILLSTGHKFRMNKKIMMPAFNINGLKNYIEVFNIHAQKLVKTLECEVGKEEFDIQNYLYFTMLSELLETTLGVSHDTLGSEGLIEYGKAVSQLCKVTHIRSYKLWMHFECIFRWTRLKHRQDEALAIVHPLTERVIAKRRNELNQKFEPSNQETGENINQYEKNCDMIEEDNVKKTRRSVLLDLLLESTTSEGKRLTEQEIKDEVLTVMFAGQDTTTVTIGFVLSLLGIYTEIQNKVYAELEDIFGDSDRPVTYEDLQRMEYLERVMQETWRLYPPIPLIARKVTADVPLETCVLPKGCTVGIITMIVHRNPEFFDHPHRFDPDNFLPERTKARHQYSFIPFSGGIRTCVGAKYAVLNIKVLLSTLLRKYRVISKRPEKEFKLVAETTLKRKEGFLIGLKLRKNMSSETINCFLVNKMTEVDVNSNECKN